MANSLCSAPTFSTKAPVKPGLIVGKSVAGKVLRINELFRDSKNARLQSMEVKAMGNNQNTKPNSIVCADCDGNGAKQCTQCQGNGINSVDHFNGQFKAGGLCWLCRGKREILCGSCNGAGFIGGFMSTFDD
ncbi:hypothetical protein SAY87_025787 [Trapa incisa]|uniref:BSD2 cysteine rich domain-containing protein n=2 Tax=Trapa TaxID=22665 RepID=A0AAN7LRM9_TRANT|nr:hypothetical protein SAY87_025787 [Trapa incisa]KAK4786158.1 hypothetical protein SAY86_002847 [Trapa natans]